MIKVVIVSDKRIIESVHENPEDDIRLAWAQEGAESRGYGVFQSGGELLYVVDRDNIFELLIRSMLNHLDLTDIETAYTKNEAMFAPLQLLGFRKNGDRVEVNIKDFFAVKPCGGK